MCRLHITRSAPGPMRALTFALLFVRTASAIAITLLLIGLLFQAYARGGPPELGSVFQVIQGVLLSTLAYLFTTQAVDRAEAEVVSEVKKRGVLEATISADSATLDEIAHRLDQAEAALEFLAGDPAIRRRIEEFEE